MNMLEGSCDIAESRRDGEFDELRASWNQYRQEVRLRKYYGAADVTFAQFPINRYRCCPTPSNKRMIGNRNIYLNVEMFEHLNCQSQPKLLESRLYVVSFVTAFEKMLRNWTPKLLFANCNFCFASSFTVENRVNRSL